MYLCIHCNFSKTFSVCSYASVGVHSIGILTVLTGHTSEVSQAVWVLTRRIWTAKCVPSVISCAHPSVYFNSMTFLHKLLFRWIKSVVAFLAIPVSFVVYLTSLSHWLKLYSFEQKDDSWMKPSWPNLR